MNCMYDSNHLLSFTPTNYSHYNNYGIFIHVLIMLHDM